LQSFLREGLSLALRALSVNGNGSRGNQQADGKDVMDFHAGTPFSALPGRAKPGRKILQACEILPGMSANNPNGAAVSGTGGRWPLALERTQPFSAW
jgi:hypothetical protein